jgi:LmbE family N-acetylglucosaminyl deacetylase
VHALAFPSSPGVRRVLAIGCHSDDIEIGCGATILELVERNPEVEVTWVVLCGTEERGLEAKASAERFLAGAAKATVQVLSYPDGFLPTIAADVKRSFEALKPVEPDLVFTHTLDDRHQDHRLACELSWNTFRDHLILEYEIPKYDGDLGRPNVFVPVRESTAREKARLVVEGFPTQAGKHWFDEDVLLGLMRLRGMECRAPERYAEAFHGRKLPLTLGEG